MASSTHDERLQGAPVDPRAASAIVLDGPADLVGDEVVGVEPVVLDEQAILVPSAMAGVPEYRTAVKAERLADDLRERIAESLDCRGGQPVAHIGLALDYRETAGTIVASGAVGLESYANFHLERHLPDGKKLEMPDGAHLSLPQLRRMGLEARFSEALPALFGRPKPTREPWWESFLRVNSLAVLQRHAINEPHTRRGLRGERSFLQRLYDAEYRGTGKTMIAAFEYFTPGWINDRRRQALDSS